MEKKTVYLETSVVSYLTNRASRDLIVVGHQTLTREWWERRRSDFTLYVSEPVLDEAGAGDPEAAAQRLSALDGIDVLNVTDEAIEFAAQLLQQGVIPAKAATDALHVALACINGIHYLLTWNCKHIANAENFDAIAAACLANGYQAPIICTPEELTGD
jgi:predicted nucleic acid-binding protein